MTHLFGTDGVRGKAGEYPLDRVTVRRLGAALARALRSDDQDARFLAGLDTRESGAWIERELAAGVRSQGGTLTSAGVVPTPAVAYLTSRLGYTAGVVISASHNPFEDNGIKVFSGSGEKLTPRLEEHVESLVAHSSGGPDDADRTGPGTDPGAVGAVGSGPDPVSRVDYRAEYVSRLRRIVQPSSRHRSVRIAVDCANGATTTVAPTLFEELGFDATYIGCEPDGRNINLGCGSTAPELLSRTVVDGGYQIGIAYDGDGDRAIFVGADGQVVDGDAVMLMCAKQLKAEGRLTGNAIVATVMSNIGLEIALRAAGIETVRCAVGDKYVMEEMRARGLALGGEQSGHVIFAEHLLTGDGLATSLHVLRTMASTGRDLADLASDLRAFPQVLMNVRVRRKVELETIPQVAAVMSAVETRLAGNGRLLVRYSGTEPLVRVMLEGRSEAEIRRWGEEIVDAIKAHVEC
ncbi:MAG: phosphoglucosamine mutase [Acidobacteria bacterium]|nr:phosphoglucosamine mutase [Acidobacteriota bacterium]